MVILQVIVDVLAVIIIHQMVLAQNQVLTHQELAEVRLVPTESRATTVLTITNVLIATIIAVGVITTAGVAAVAGAIVVHLVAVAQVGAVVVHQVVVAAAQVAHLALAHVVHVNS